MALETKPFDSAKYFNTPEALADLVEDAFDSGHAPYIADSLGLAARRYGIAKLSRETGINRQALYRSLSKHGNPTLTTLLAVTKALGFRVTVAVAVPQMRLGRTPFRGTEPPIGGN